MGKNRLRLLRSGPATPTHFIPSFIVFIMMMILIGFSWQNAIRSVDQNKKDQVAVRSAFLESTLTQRLVLYENFLKSGNGLFTASNSVDRNEWTLFANEMEFSKRFPAIMALGYTEILDANQIDSFVQCIRKEGIIDFEVKPEEPTRSTYAVVSLIEPLNDRNKNVLGEDLYSDPTRRKFMEEARDSNTTTMSDVALLRQNDNSWANGIYLFHPVYKKEMPTNTISQRRAAVSGYVYSAIRLDKLFENLLENQQNIDSFNFVVYDGDKLSPETLLYENKPKQESENFEQIDKRILKNIGQDWTIEYGVGENIVPLAIRGRPDSVIVGGLLFSLIVATIVFLLLQRRTRLIAMAEDKRLQRAKDDMLSLASHQLRTPATGVKQYLGMVLEGFTGKITKEQHDILGRAYESNERQLRIINEFLYLAKAEAERIVISPQKFDLVEFTKQVIDDMSNEINESDHKLKFKHPKNQNCTADKHSTRMIIENLISNAIKYTPSGGEITVSIKSKSNEALVEVSDNGVGIAKKHFPKLFKQFSRIPNELSKYTSGSGIGLYLSQVLAQQNNGFISVDSEIGKGSTFTAHFPRKSVKNITVKSRPKT
ncbi:MAG: CHASE domain-containing protein [bacterium]|nr:CHASE domain-containing protein [bacterium]